MKFVWTILIVISSEKLLKVRDSVKWFIKIRGDFNARFSEKLLKTESKEMRLKNEK